MNSITKLKKIKLRQLSDEELRKLNGGCVMCYQDIKTYNPGGKFTDRSYSWDSCSGPEVYV